MSHLILLDDSIFDNAAYTEGGPDVVMQLRAALPAGWAASLLAIDGSTTDDIAVQILRVAISHRLPVIDLRAICASPEDYANPIEPSSAGGAKIARAIAALATHSAPSDNATRTLAGA